MKTLPVPERPGESPTVSFCIPTHNRTQLLLQALESALAQTRLPDEILVSDDLGSEQVSALVSDFGKRSPVSVRYSRSPVARNQAENVNHCLRSARSDLLLLLHDDDLLMPRAVEMLRQPFLEDESLIATYGKQIVISEDGVDLPSDALNEKFRRTADHAGLQPDAFLAALRQQFPNDGYMVKASAARKVLLRPEAGAAADFDFGIRLSVEGRFFFVNEFTAKYRLSRESVARGSRARRDNSSVMAMRLCLGLLKTHPRYADEIGSTLRWLAPRAVRMALLQGAFGEALSWYFGPYYPDKILPRPGFARGGKS